MRRIVRAGLGWACALAATASLAGCAGTTAANEPGPAPAPAPQAAAPPVAPTGPGERADPAPAGATEPGLPPDTRTAGEEATPVESEPPPSETFEPSAPPVLLAQVRFEGFAASDEAVVRGLVAQVRLSAALVELAPAPAYLSPIAKRDDVYLWVEVVSPDRAARTEASLLASYLARAVGRALGRPIAGVVFRAFASDGSGLLYEQNSQFTSDEVTKREARISYAVEPAEAAVRRRLDDLAEASRDTHPGLAEAASSSAIEVEVRAAGLAIPLVTVTLAPDRSIDRDEIQALVIAAAQAHPTGIAILTTASGTPLGVAGNDDGSHTGTVDVGLPDELGRAN